MKITNKLVVILSICALVALNTSCVSLKMPQSVNTLSSVKFKDLRLDRNEFEILNAITSEATVVCKYSIDKKKMNIVCQQDDNFLMSYKKIGKVDASGKKTFVYVLKRHKGVLRLGLLDEDITTIQDNDFTAEYIARKIALYYLNNQIKDIGGDCIIEPVITTNFEDRGYTIVYHATASGKPIKIKTDKNLGK